MIATASHTSAWAPSVSLKSVVTIWSMTARNTDPGATSGSFGGFVGRSGRLVMRRSSLRASRYLFILMCSSGAEWVKTFAGEIVPGVGLGIGGTRVRRSHFRSLDGHGFFGGSDPDRSCVEKECVATVVADDWHQGHHLDDGALKHRNHSRWQVAYDVADAPSGWPGYRAHPPLLWPVFVEPREYHRGLFVRHFSVECRH